MTTNNQNETIDMNQLFNLNYNFDLLKTILTGLMKQNKTLESQLNELRDKTDQKDKIIQNLDSKLVSSVRSLTDKIEEKSKELEENQIKLFKDEEAEKSKFGINKFKQDEKFNDLYKKIEQLQQEDNNNKSRIQSLENSLNDLNKLNLKEIANSTKTQTNELSETREKAFELESKVNKLENGLENINIKLAEINIFESLKLSLGDAKDGAKGDLSSYIVLIEGLKKSVYQKFEFTDSKLESIQDVNNKLKLENGLLGRKVENLLSDEVENKNQLENNTRMINELKTQINSLNISSDPSNRKSNKNKSSGKDQMQDLSKYKELLERIEAIKEEIIELQKMRDADDPNSKIKQDNNQVGIINTDESSTEVRVVRENKDNNNLQINQLKQKIIDLEKSLKIMNIREKENEESINKKFTNLTEQLKDKVISDDFYKLNDNINALNSQIDMLKERFSMFDEKTMLSEILWMKKKVETLSGGLQEIRNYANKSGGAKEDIEHNSASHESFYLGKYVELNSFNDFKVKNKREVDKITEEVEEINKCIEEIKLQLKMKSDEKDMKMLAGKFIDYNIIIKIIYLLN